MAAGNGVWRALPLGRPKLRAATSRQGARTINQPGQERAEMAPPSALGRRWALGGRPKWRPANRGVRAPPPQLQEGAHSHPKAPAIA